MFGLELGEVLGLAALGERATGLHVGQQHLARGVKDFGGLGHEMYAAKNDDVCRGFLCALRQGEAVANVVGEFLYFVPLVVVTQYDGVLFLFQSQYLLLQFFVGHRCICFFV